MIKNIKLIESFTQAKNPKALNEDLFFVSNDFVMVVDGATDKSGRLWDSKTGGRLVAEIAVETLAQLNPEVTAYEASEELTRQVARRLGDVPVFERPMASVVIYSRVHHQLWRVGDVMAGYRTEDGSFTTWEGAKAIDKVTSDARAALLNALVLSGESFEGDPGREMILPLLRLQAVFANADPSIALAYGVLNGLPIPTPFLEVLSLPADVLSVTICSDGFIAPEPSLRIGESLLAASLETDPMRIGENAGTKGVNPGATSFDDRTYLRFDLI